MKLDVLRLVLPATLAVTTFAAGTSCNSVPEYCVDIEEREVCDAQAGCGWDQEHDLCTNVCDEIEDEAECEAIERCEWSPPFDSATAGEEASCHEPYT
ncbi:MAG: hypothetical protein R3A79_29340 [Nannocystaceae bacterium]